MLSQYNYSIEYRKTSDHGNTDALSRLPDAYFDVEESEAAIDTVCTIKAVSLQLKPTNPSVLAKESRQDPVNSTVICHTREGWPSEDSRSKEEHHEGYSVTDSLSTAHGCLLYGSSW